MPSSVKKKSNELNESWNIPPLWTPPFDGSKSFRFDQFLWCNTRQKLFIAAQGPCRDQLCHKALDPLHRCIWSKDLRICCSCQSLRCCHPFCQCSLMCTGPCQTLAKSWSVSVWKRQRRQNSCACFFCAASSHQTILYMWFCCQKLWVIRIRNTFSPLGDLWSNSWELQLGRKSICWLWWVSWALKILCFLMPSELISKILRCCAPQTCGSTWGKVVSLFGPGPLVLGRPAG